MLFFFSSRRRHTRCSRDWSSDVCSSDLESNYSGYLEKKAKRLEQEEREEKGKQKAINDELDWIRRSPKARQAKSKARIRSEERRVGKECRYRWWPCH